MSPKTRGGFTLLEVMISAAILAVAVMALVAGITQNIQQGQWLSERRIAHVGTGRVLEGVRSAARVSLANAVASYNADPADDPGGPYTAPGNAFSVQGLTPPTGGAQNGGTGEVVLDSTDPDLVEVTVRVRWASTGGENVEYTLQTRVTHP